MRKICMYRNEVSENILYIQLIFYLVIFILHNKSHLLNYYLLYNYKIKKIKVFLLCIILLHYILHFSGNKIDHNHNKIYAASW